MARTNFKRWYEKNECLNAFMNLMRDLPLEEQCEIAIDVIIQASSMIERDYENIIKEVGLYNPKDFRRWYDKNPNIHVAIESLRDLDDIQREEVIKNVSYRILKKHKVEGIDSFEDD